MSDFVWNDELVKEWVGNCNQKFSNPDLHGGWLGYSTEIQKFKEEHAKPKLEWEILKFKVKYPPETIFIKKDNGQFGYLGDGIISETDMLKEGHAIYSVRRLSDGEVFFVGDEVEYYDGNKAKIVQFDQDGFRVVGGDSKFYTSIDHLKKATKPIPIFKTEDGVDCFEGGKWWSVWQENCRRWRQWDVCFSDGYVGDTYNPDAPVKRFSTKEAAEEYILMNKSLLSLSEVFKHSALIGSEAVRMERELTKIAKEKLSK